MCETRPLDLARKLAKSGGWAAAPGPDEFNRGGISLFWGGKINLCRNNNITQVKEKGTVQ